MRVPISYSRYNFDGTFVNGKINGNGVLTISPESPLQNKCIIVKSSVFDLPLPDKIEGEFQVRPSKSLLKFIYSEKVTKIKKKTHYGFDKLFRIGQKFKFSSLFFGRIENTKISFRD